MKTLILMRHAKSSWSDPDLADHDRPLSKRGKKSAPVMATWLAGQGALPERILSSSSQRTRQTIARMRKAVPGLPEPEFHAALYDAAPEAVLANLRQLPEDCDCALLIGHEPAMSLALRMLDGRATAPELRRAYAHFPTAAMAVVESDVADWREIGAGRERLVAFAVPRDLMG